MHVRRTLLPLAAVLALLVAACGTSGDSGSAAVDPAAPSPTELQGEITVSAASSLTKAFTQIGTDFEFEHPGTTILFNFDSSSTLAQQIIDGAPVDVFASADQANVDKVAEADLVEDGPLIFARNRLVIVTKPRNPAGIESLDDLVGAGVISLCGVDVPCGTYAAESLASAGVTIPESSVTRGQNATATIAAVRDGDAVAGIVYLTDALVAGDDVTMVEIPDENNVIATYPIVVVAGSQNASLASAFARHLASEDAQTILAENGFLPPS